MVTTLGGELFEKLGRFVVILSLVNAGTPAVTPSAGMERRWEMSDASTMVEPARATLRGMQLALTEVRSARAILSVHEATEDRAFWSYVTAVEQAVNSYDLSDKGERATRGLAASLAFARAALQDQVATLPTWMALSRAAFVDLDRYPTVPARFKAQPVSMLEVAAPSVEDVDLWATLELVSVV
jgi:hypothetical protein